MTDREAFEKWIVTTDINCLYVTRRENIDDDTYYLAKTHIAWLAWQTACKYKDETQQARCVLKIGHCGLQG